jgi:hypothetical protein
MNLISKLLSRTPSVLDIRLHLKEIERDQIRQRRHLDILTQTKQEKISQAVEHKKGGRQDLVQEIFRAVRQIEIDIGNANSDLRRISLSKMALNSLLRKAQMLEHEKDRKSMQNLMLRFQDKSIQKAIDTAEVDDDTFNEMLEGILGEAEDSVIQGKVKEDAGFAEFNSAISQMAEAEESGAGTKDRLHPQPDLISGMAIQKDHDAPTKESSTAHFSLVNDAGLKQKSERARADSAMVGSTGIDGDLNNAADKICVCSHEIDQCYHRARGGKLVQEAPPMVADKICVCSHEMDECYHSGRGAKHAQDVPPMVADKICVCSHEMDECYHSGRGAKHAQDVPPMVADKICVCSHEIDECYHSGRGAKHAQDAPQTTNDQICLCSHEMDECFHGGRGGIQAQDVPQGAADKICVCSHEIDQCYHRARGGA